jgi:hypothetical protein
LNRSLNVQPRTCRFVLPVYKAFDSLSRFTYNLSLILSWSAGASEQRCSAGFV